MMNSLYSYHLRSYSLSFLTILSLLLVLFIIAQSASFLTIAIEGGLSAFSFGEFILHKVPVQIVDLAPICVIAGVAATSTQLASAGEFAVLRAAGVSESSFFRPVLVFSGFLALAYALITFEIAPRSFQALETLEAQGLEQAASNVLVTPGEPTRIGNVELIAQEVDAFTLKKVSLFGTSQTQLNIFINAKSAAFITNETGLSLALESGRILRDQVGPIDVQEFESVLVDLTALTTSAPNVQGQGAEEGLRLPALLNQTHKSERLQRIHGEELAGRLSFTAFIFAVPTWIMLWGLAFRQLRGGGSWLAHTGTVTAFVLLILLESSKASFSTSASSLIWVLLLVIGLGLVGPLFYYAAALYGKWARGV